MTSHMGKDSKEISIAHKLQKIQKTQILILGDFFYKKLIPPDHLFIKIILCPEKKSNFE